jgi:hypothetical protein
LPFLWVTGKKLQNQYKDFCDFKIWNQNHAKDYLSSRELRQTFIDRRNSSSNGELYTILTNKAAKERKGTSSYDCWN